MATVYNNIDKVAGNPYASVVVSLELLWDTSVSLVAKVEEDEVMVRGTYGTETDADGRWEVDGIVPNDEITPADSVYKVTERDASNNTVTYYISVPNAATPTSWVADIIVDTPDWI
jgi:hypothetical protein